MIRIFYLFFLINSCIGYSFARQQLSDQKTTESFIYSKHWLDKLPLTKKQDLLLIHDLFIISFNLEKKFPAWITYQLSPNLVWGDLKAARKYIPDPLLPKQHSLNSKDHKGASNCDGKHSGYDKGHLAPVGSFKASPYIYQAQYLSNIVPQKRNLNQGPWKKLEELTRAFVKKGNIVHILAGPIFGKEGRNKTAPCWKAAQGKITEVPAAYWKIVAFKQKSKIKACTVWMPQGIKYRKDHPKKYQVKLTDIEEETGLVFFQETTKNISSDCKFLF